MPRPADPASLKTALRRELALRLKEEVLALERAQRITQQAATHEEAKPENDKDTRALEQSYLARGQAMRALEARAAVGLVEATPVSLLPEGACIALGALVVVTEEEAETSYWIAAEGGGARLDEGRIQVVTPKSPLGRALIGKVAGDELELPVAGRTRVLQIERVS